MKRMVKGAENGRMRAGAESKRGSLAATRKFFLQLETVTFQKLLPRVV